MVKIGGSAEKATRPKLSLGMVCMTAGINEAQLEDPLFSFEVLSCFSRYQIGDWGDLCKEDKDANREALENGNRVLASYHTTHGKVYIITEADRSATTILFANEY